MSTRKKSNYDEIIRNSKFVGEFRDNKIVTWIFNEKFVISGENTFNLFFRFIKEILAVVIIFVLILGGLFSSSKIMSFFVEDDYSAIYSDIDYSKSVSLGLEGSASESSASFVLNTITNWANESSVYSISTDYLSPENMTAEIGNLVGDSSKVHLSQNVDNYIFFEMIYNSIKSECAVIVSGVNPDTLSLEYSIVVGFNPSDDEITILKKTGDEQVMTLEEFVAYVGLDDFVNTDDKLTQTLVLSGVFNQNTAIFVYN